MSYLVDPGCQLCPALAGCRSQVVQGVGGDGGIMFVGQNPNTYADKDGKPFVGKDGQLLRLLSDAAGIDPHDVYRTNAVRCLSPGNRKPKREEIDACRGFLLEEIRAVQPGCIVALGEVPLTALYGLGGSLDFHKDLETWQYVHDDALTQWQGRIQIWNASPAGKFRKENFPEGKPRKPTFGHKPQPPKMIPTTITGSAGQTLIQPETGIPIVPTFHPAYLLRGKWELSTIVIEHLKKAQRIANGQQKPGVMGTYVTIDTVDKLRTLADYLTADPSLTIWFDTETTGLKWMKDEVLCISFSSGIGEGFVVPILWNDGSGNPDLHPAWAGGKHLELFKQLERIFASPNPKGGQNMLFDLRFMERSSKSPHIEALTAFAFKVNGLFKDTELCHQSIAESLPHNMTSTTAIWTDLPWYEDDIKQYKKAMNKAPNNIIWPYSAADADGLPRLWKPLREQAEREHVDWVLDNVTTPMIRVCRDIEEQGFPINRDYFDRLCKFYALEIEKTEEELWNAVPWRVPDWKYNYPPVLREVLFKEIKLPVSGRKTEGGRGCQDCNDGVCFEHDQTGKDALKEIAALSPHPVLDILLRLKTLTKLKSTYLDGGRGGWKQHIRPDGRIHPSFKISRVESGRLASEEPNCQNLVNFVHIHPIGATCADSNCTAFYDETFGIDTTNAFHDFIEAGPGKGIMNADWSQLEIWVLAYRLLRDFGSRSLLDVLESGVDIHLWMARQMYPNIDPGMDDKEWKNVHSDLRRRAKVANFGIGYGLTAQGFVNREGCTLQEAEDTIARYKAIVPIDLYFKAIRDDVFNRGGCWDEFGRVRHIRTVALLKAMREAGDLEATLREAVNFPIQAGGSDLHSLVSAATNQLAELRKRGCRIILSVHDSLTFEFDWPSDQYALETAWLIKDLWQSLAWSIVKSDGQPLHWRVPVEVEWGKNYGTPEWKLDARGALQKLTAHERFEKAQDYDQPGPDEIDEPEEEQEIA